MHATTPEPARAAQQPPVPTRNERIERRLRAQREAALSATQGDIRYCVQVLPPAYPTGTHPTLYANKPDIVPPAPLTELDVRVMYYYANSTARSETVLRVLQSAGLKETAGPHWTFAGAGMKPSLAHL